MLDHEERLGYIRLGVSVPFLFLSLLALTLFGISPKICGIGFIMGAILGFMGQHRISRFLIPIDNIDRFLFILIFILINCLYVPAAFFGLLLVYNLI